VFTECSGGRTHGLRGGRLRRLQVQIVQLDRRGLLDGGIHVLRGGHLCLGRVRRMKRSSGTWFAAFLHDYQKIEVRNVEV
jgi:hypothetical protein